MKIVTPVPGGEVFVQTRFKNGRLSKGHYEDAPDVIKNRKMRAAKKRKAKKPHHD